MKSRIRSAIPKKIIGINISSQKRDIIEDIAKSENADAVFFDSRLDIFAVSRALSGLKKRAKTSWTNALFFRALTAGALTLY